MKMLALPFMLLSLTLGTYGAIKTAELMEHAAAVVIQATQPR